MAEEQLSHLNRYMAQASVVYQREIVKLRAMVKQLDPSGVAVSGMAAATAGTAAAAAGHGRV
jgi:hypothetical protein